ncbi:MAG: hypothetical protein HY644_01630 [Acidobacteria bacterium]|nr:hypothetical protein [Acidobacteriota bacterium]
MRKKKISAALFVITFVATSLSNAQKVTSKNAYLEAHKVCLLARAAIENGTEANLGGFFEELDFRKEESMFVGYDQYAFLDKLGIVRVATKKTNPCFVLSYSWLLGSPALHPEVVAALIARASKVGISGTHEVDITLSEGPRGSESIKVKFDGSLSTVTSSSYR